jgi:hypothetical protein
MYAEVTHWSSGLARPNSIGAFPFDVIRIECERRKDPALRRAVHRLGGEPGITPAGPMWAPAEGPRGPDLHSISRTICYFHLTPKTVYIM